jgi:tight adherence protein C
MTQAMLLAGLSGVAAAGAIVELSATLARQRAARAAGGPRRAGRARAVAALARLGKRIGAPVPGADLERRLDAAGRPLGLEVADVAAIKGGAALVALLAGAPLVAALPGRLPVVAAIALPAGGLIAPDLLLARLARRRGREMEAELPELLDLLRVAVEAGLPVGRALGEVGRRHGGALAREWRRAAEELELGVSRERALAAMVRRCPPPAIATLVAAVGRAERHGAPLGETLAAQATEARAARALRICERAERAAPKIQLVVALLLVPSVLLLVAAALVAGLR